MGKVYKKRISFFILTLFFMNIFLSQFSFAVKAEGNAVQATKNINKTSALPGEEIDVTLNVKGTPPVNTVKPNDVILIIDKSGSMRGSKIQDAKNSAKSFIDLMDMTKHRVGIVDFSSVIDSMPLTDNAEQAKKYVDVIRDGGATYTGRAVREAKKLLQNCRPGAQPVIVIMTDGAANFGGNERVGFYDAKAAAKEAKDAGIVFYTIALLDSRDNPSTSPQNAVLKEMATTAQHHHFVLGSLGLEAIYKGIVKEIGVASAYDVNIKDVVSPEFEIVPGSYDSNIPKPQVNGNEISWHLLELKDQQLTFNYKIRAKKDAKLGTYPIASESKVQYKDFAGTNKTVNINIPSVTLEYPAPTITEVIPNNGEIAGGNEITIKGTNFKPEAKVYFDNAEGTNVKIISENEIKVTAPAATQKTAKLKVQNKDGKCATSSYLYWAKPIVTSITPNKGPVAGNTKVTINGNYFLNGIEVKFGKKPAKKVIYKNPTLIYALTDSADAEGYVDVTLTNPDISKSETVVKNGFNFEDEKILAPVVKTITPSEGYTDEVKNVKITGENFRVGAKVLIGAKEATNVKVENETTITATVPTVIEPEVVDVKVVNDDAQEGKLEKSYKYIKRPAPAPTVTGVSPNSCYINETPKVTIDGKDFQKAAKVYIGGVEATNVDSSNSKYIYATVPASKIPAIVDVKVVNPDGKEVILSKGFTYKDTPAPEITEITPNHGIYNEQKRISIYAKNFKPGVKVKIGDKDAVEITVCSSYIDVKVPTVDEPKSVDVTIINPDGKQAKVVKGYTYKPIPEKPAPIINNIKPNCCYINEIKSITINGSNFQQGAKVYLGEVEATNVDSSYSTCLYAKVPAKATPAIVDVKVVNPDGKEVILKDGFTYKDTPSPEITKTDIKEVYVKQVKYVNIYGKHFQKGAVVKFGDKDPVYLSYCGEEALLVKCPMETTPQTVDITVINPDGKKGQVKDAFTYKPEPSKPAPIIENVKQNWSYIGSTKRVTINGSNFQQGAKVYIGGIEATNVDSTYSTYLYAKVPVKDKPSIVDVKVVNPDGKEVILKDGFTYKDTPGPEVTSISPNEGIYNEEKNISIYANNIEPGVKVKIGDQYALKTSFCNSYIYVKVPKTDGPKSVDITVINPDGKETKVVNGYTYKPVPEKPAPTIKEITPNSVLINSTKNISIYGNNFQEGISVKFGDVKATKVEYISSTYISVYVPKRATEGKVDVTLTNPDGKNVVLPQGFSYKIPDVKIDSLSPNHGKLQGGYLVGIYGENFAEDSEVYVDGKKVDKIEYANSSLIYISKMPAREKDGQVDVEVRSASLKQSKTIKFTYDPKPVTPAPQIQSHSSRFVFGDLKLDIYAYYLSPNMAIRIESTGEEVKNRSTSSTYVSFVVPSTYRGKKEKITLINKDENKESASYEVQF